MTGMVVIITVTALLIIQRDQGVAAFVFCGVVRGTPMAPGTYVAAAGAAAKTPGPATTATVFVCPGHLKF